MLSYFFGSSNNNLSEEEAENRLLAEKWYTYSSFASFDKLKISMKTPKTFMEYQLELEKYTPINTINYLLEADDIFTNKSFRKATRKGIPIHYTRQILGKMYQIPNNEINLKTAYLNYFKKVFKNIDPINLGENVPYFSSYYTLNENLGSLNYLNNQGIIALKEILWLVYYDFPKIEFCPLIPKVISFLLIFCKKEETYFLIKTLIVISMKEKSDEFIRFQFKFTISENKKILQSFIDSFNEISKYTSKVLYSKLHKINFKFENLIEDMFLTLFADYFNFTIQHKIFFLFIHEGVKALYRIAYAILKLLVDDIINIKTAEEVIPFIKQKCKELKNYDTLFETGYNYGLTRYNNKYDTKIVSNLDFKWNVLSSPIYYIPTFDIESNILQDKDILNIWCLLPEVIKKCNANLIYKSYTTDMGDLENMYERCKLPEFSLFYCIMFILTTDKDLFGILLSKPFNIVESNFYKPNYAFLFTLSPETKLYEVSTDSDYILLCKKDKLVIGLGKNGPAIELNKSLSLGVSYKCDIFSDSELLSNTQKTDFIVDKFELYSIS